MFLWVGDFLNGFVGVRAQGISIKIRAWWHQLSKWNLAFKKTLHASEQKGEGAQGARGAWRQALPTMEVEKLVFIDETWISTSMTRRHGRAPTFVGALRPGVSTFGSVV